MNDQTDIPLHPSADEVVEARIVAWVLGEASAFEIAELERLCAEKPELAAFHRRMLALQGLLADAVGQEGGDEWKLSEAKAKTIHEAFGDGSPEPGAVVKSKRPLWKRPQPWIGVAACLAVSTVVWRYNEEKYDGSYGALGTGRSLGEDAPIPAAREGMMSAEEPRSALRRAIGGQEKKVEESRKKLSNIVREKGIVYTGEESIFRSAPADPAGAESKSKRSVDGLKSNSEIARNDNTGAIMKAERQTAESSLAPAQKQMAEESSDGLAKTTPLPAGDVSGIMTGGLRSGNAEIARNNIDAILNAPASPAAPAPVTATPAAPIKPRDARTRVLPPTPDTASGSLSGLAKKEATLRQEAVADADRLLLEGREAFAKGDYEKAVDLYAKSKKSLPDAPSLTDRQRETDVHLSDASVALAQQYRKIGKYEEARKLLQSINPAQDDPARAALNREMAFLDDPVRTNPALTYEQPGNPDELRRALYMAEGNYNLGKYDDAKKDYEAALRADPYNSAARRGLERLATAKSDYYRAAYDHTRSELLMEVDKAWELDVPKVEKRQETLSAFSKVPEASPGQSFSMNLKLPSEPNSGVGTASGYALPDTTYSMVDSLKDLGKLQGDPKPDESGLGLEYRFKGEGAKVGDDMITAGADTSPADNISTIQPSTEIFINGKLVEWSGFDSNYNGQSLDKDYPKMGTVALAAKAPIDFNEIATAEEAFSTFSLNVSDVSFQLALASLEKGESPDPAAIKVEQFYNAVDYGDPAPSGNEIATKIEQSAHPVIPGRNIVRLGVKTASAGRSAAQPLNLTLMIDQSGSMVRDDRRAALQKALAELATLLTEKDRVSVIGFSRTPSLLADAIPGNQLGTVTGMMNGEAAEAGTNLEEALHLASQIALRQATHGAGNRIVLFTDGAANLGDADPARLAEKVRVLRQEGVAFDVAGIGADGLNDRLLAELARNGDGRYLFAAGNIAAQLAGAFRPAAEDVKVQVRFNPERVSRYKLIGFEEDRLNKEDFRNDAVDAAELAADEAAVALYQVELIPDGKGEIGEMSVRFRDAASGEMVERSWTITHDANTPVFDRASPSMQLAGLSMLAAEKLKGGPMAPMIDLKKHSGAIAAVHQYYANSSKVSDMLRLIGLLAR